MMLISPSLRARIVHTTHRCSGRLFLVHLRHKEEDLVIVALYGVSSPTSSDDKKFMRAQLAEALTQIAQEYDGKPFMVVGDYNAAASPDDRGTGKLLPYDTAPDALTVVLMRLSLTDVYRQNSPTPKSTRGPTPWAKSLVLAQYTPTTPPLAKREGSKT